MWNKIKNWLKPKSVDLTPEPKVITLGFSDIEERVYDKKYEEIYTSLLEHGFLNSVNEKNKALTVMCHYIPLDEDTQSWFFKVFENLLSGIVLKEFYLSSLVLSCENKKFLSWIQSIMPPQTKLTKVVYKSLVANDFYKKEDTKDLVFHQTLKDYYLFFDLFEVIFKNSIKEENPNHYLNNFLMVLHVLNKRLDIHRDSIVTGVSLLDYFQPSESLKLKALDALFNIDVIRNDVAFELLMWELMYSSKPHFLLTRYQKKLLDNDWNNLKDIASINKNDELLKAVSLLRPKSKEDESN